MLRCHKGAVEKYVITLRDGCGDVVPVATTGTITGAIVTDYEHRMLVGTATSDSTDTVGDWSAGVITLQFSSTLTDAADELTDTAKIMLSVDEGTGPVAYETPRSSVAIVAFPLA